MAALDTLSAWASSFARLGIGTKITGGVVKPDKPIELYEFEACPFCRKVRDVLTTLDLDAMIYPCPKGGERFRPKVIGEGKRQFPYMEDPNTGVAMYESDDITEYLFQTYAGRPPSLFFRSPLNTGTSILASAVRPTRGMRVRSSQAPAQPLELYSFEASPYSRIAREALCELEIPYLLRNVGKGSNVDFLLPPMRDRFAADVPMSTDKRREFVERSGRMMVPYLIDPNTGTEMFESREIVKYLNDRYAV
jgi:glutathione S-transferase